MIIFKALVNTYISTNDHMVLVVFLRVVDTFVVIDTPVTCPPIVCTLRTTVMKNCAINILYALIYWSINFHFHQFVAKKFIV